MFSFDETPRTGWLIDDVSVALDVSPVGLLSVTNNLEQASFVLTGPITTRGSGRTLDLTNAPVGEYVVQWSPVDFSLTPPPQTNTLAATSPLRFVGHYTFPDSNANGISDLFEQFYFHGVATPHPPATDTDGDAAGDYAEFMAGTDPADPESRLEVTAVNLLPNRTVRIEWRSVPGRAYQLELSTNATDWLPTSNWLRAVGNISFVTLPPLAGSPEYLFRLQVRP